MQVTVGRIGRPHGIRGAVVVGVRTDEPELRFAKGSRLDTDPAGRGPLIVAGSRWHSGELLVRFEGIDDRDAAGELRGTWLLVDSATIAPPDDPDEFRDGDLIGLVRPHRRRRRCRHGRGRAALRPGRPGHQVARRARGHGAVRPAARARGRRCVGVPGHRPSRGSPQLEPDLHPTSAGACGSISSPSSLVYFGPVGADGRVGDSGPLGVSLIGKAGARGDIDFRVHDLRAWTTDVHHTVDDTPFGGGPGMVMKPDVWGDALDAVLAAAGHGPPTPARRRGWSCPRRPARPSPRRWPPSYAGEAHLVFACGRYEGIDSRVVADARTRLAVDEVSIGDYVLAGGEAAVVGDRRGGVPAAARGARERAVA